MSTEQPVYAWLCQSHFSFLQGASSPLELAQTARDLGYEGMALSDFDGAYGLVQAYKAKRELESETFRMFYGMQFLWKADVGVEAPSPRSFDDNLPVFWQNRIVLLAATKKAHAQISKLATYVHRFEKQARAIDLNDSDVPWPEDAIAILPSRGVQQLISPHQIEKQKLWISCVKLLCQKLRRVYFSVTPPTTPYETNAFLLHLAAHRELGHPLLATPDVFFHEPGRKELHDTMTSIRLNAPLHTVSWACFANEERCFSDIKEFKRFFAQTPELVCALENNTHLASLLSFCPSELKYEYPSEFIPPGFTVMTYLRLLLEDAGRERYGAQLPKKVRDLLEKEFILVEELKFADYFLTVYDIVREAKRLKILFNGRGSATNSVICFLLGISSVDPMVSDVLFERFISRERGEPPDIDVDFEHERREEIIQYIYQRYGRPRAAMVANVISYQKRGALRAVGKTLGIKEGDLSTVLATLHDRSKRGRNMTQVVNDGLAHAKGQLVLDDVTVEKWTRMAAQLRGFPRHLGIHSGGFVVSQHALDEICPQEPATMANRTVIQWNKDDIETLGLFKIDVLALGMLTALRKTFAMLNQDGKRIPGTLKPFALDVIPEECPTTYKMIQAAKTTGVFQIESRAQMSVLPRTLPYCFYDLVVQVGIIRPGPIVSGMLRSYMERREGRAPMIILDKRLEPILARTLGVPIFQEQVMRIAIAVGDFTPGEADELRRSMGAWKMTGNIKKFEDKLRTGMKGNGISDEFAEVIVKQIEGFAQYGFPESHSTAFAFLAYVSCYLKAHHPAYFLCGLLNSQPLGFYSVHSLVREARHEGVKVRPVCVLHSQWDSHVDKTGAVRLGFRTMSILQKTHLEKLVELRTAFAAVLKARRAREPLKTILVTFDEALEWVEPLTSAERVTLAMGNCFRAVRIERREALWKILAQRASLLMQDELLSFYTDPHTEAWDNLQDDFKHTGTSLYGHPSALVKEHAWPFAIPISQVTPSNELNRLGHNARVNVFGVCIVRQSPPTAKGFVFITLEDEFGTMNIIIKPPVYAKFHDLFLYHDLICVQGIKQKNGTQSTIIATGAVSFATEVRAENLVVHPEEWSFKEVRLFH